MKGALLKELYVLKSSRMIALIIVYAASLILSLVFKTFLLGICMHILLFIAPLIHASKDDRHGWSSFGKALPVSVAKRVGARYIVCIGELLFLNIFYTVTCMIMGAAQIGVMLKYSVENFFVGALALSLILFLCYKLRRGARTALVIVAVVVFSAFGDSANIHIGTFALYMLEPWFAWVSLISGCALLGISYILSVRAETEKVERSCTMRKTMAIIVSTLAVTACVCVCLLGVRGRLVPEPILDIDSFVMLDTDSRKPFLHNVRKRSNRQTLSNAEMYDALRELTDKKIVQGSVEETVRMLEQAGFKAIRGINSFLIDPGEMAFSSKYDTLTGYIFYDGFSLNSACSAKYVPVNDNSEMSFDTQEFKIGISETELINLLEEKDIPIFIMDEEGGTKYTFRTYTVYIAYENVNTKEIFFEEVFFRFENGKLDECESGLLDVSYADFEDKYYADEEEFIITVREYMMAYAKAFCDGIYAGGDIETCIEKLDAIGAIYINDGVFEGYIYGEENFDISMNESSRHPGTVHSIEISGYTGENRYDTMTEHELGELKYKFRIGMSDRELVEMLEKEELYPDCITENIDTTFNPEKIYKCYRIPLIFGEYNGTQFEQDCEISVELYNGKVANVRVYLNGWIDPEP